MTRLDGGGQGPFGGWTVFRGRGDVEFPAFCSSLPLGSWRGGEEEAPPEVLRAVNAWSLVWRRLHLARDVAAMIRALLLTPDGWKDYSWKLRTAGR